MFLNYFALGVLIFVFWSFLWDYRYSRYSLFDCQNATTPIPMLFMSPDGSVFLLSMSSGRFYGYGPRCTNLSAAGACSIRRIRTPTNLKKKAIYNSFAND